MDPAISLFPVKITSWGALDRYFGQTPAPITPASYPGTLDEIAPRLDPVTYPKNWLGSLEYHSPHGRYCISTETPEPRSIWYPGTFTFDPLKRSFQDPLGIYPFLRKDFRGMSTQALDPPSGWGDVAEAAVLASRYNWFPDPIESSQKWLPMSPSGQLSLLELILSSPKPWKGLEYLEGTGFLACHWALLDNLRQVEHTKDFHPEGNGWNHTMETFRFRKKPDLVTDLALLLHDVGKSSAPRANGNRFDRHAEIGARQAKYFVRSLGLDNRVQEDVYFLVRHHMVPGLLDTVPAHRFERILMDERMGKLMEVYRGDSGAVWRGPEQFYRISKIVKKFRQSRGLASLELEKSH